MTDRQNIDRGLALAVNMIMADEPGDSRAVSNEAVALAALSAGDDSEPVMKVINEALERPTSKQPDYRKILKSYMRSIIRQEGITFVTMFLQKYDPEQTPEEALTAAEREAIAEINADVRRLEAAHI